MTDEKVISFNENGCYLLTLETIGEIDFFVRPVYKQIIVHSLNHFIDNKGFIIYAWCLMSNRLYLICQVQKNILLGDIRKGFKQFTTEKIIDAMNTETEEKRALILDLLEKQTVLLNRPFNIWNQIKNPVSIDMYKPETMAEQIEWIHNMPVKERFVQYPEDYLYSSAKDYQDGNGLVSIIKLSPVEQQLNAIENRKNGFRSNFNRQ